MLLALSLSLSCTAGPVQEVYPAPPEGPPPVLANDAATATSADEMQVYVERIPGTSASFSMTPLPGGTFTMGSPSGERDRDRDEASHEVTVSPFWIETHEVTWAEYHEFMLKLDLERFKRGKSERVEQDAWADAVSRPTPPYVPMDFEMGTDETPAICMTQFAAKQYTKWLSMKTGRFYRLPTEAEWEYACRAGTEGPYSCAVDELEDHAWFFDNADDSYQKVMTKKPNPWGLYDMHGNVAEWVLDAHTPDYAGHTGTDPITWPEELYPRVVRGGSWDDDPEDLRSAARRASKKSWKVQDPQLPKSIWYHTDATFVGFRVVRPLHPPPPAERERFWEADVDSVRKVQDRQRKGDR